MSNQTALLTLPYYIFHSDKGAHHCVCFYVLSYYSCHYMPYYTHHKHNGANHCVCVCALPDYSFDGMPYYTHHKNQGAHHSVCVYGLSDYTCHYALLHTAYTYGRSALCNR